MVDVLGPRDIVGATVADTPEFMATIADDLLQQLRQGPGGAVEGPRGISGRLQALAGGVGTEIPGVRYPFSDDLIQDILRVTRQPGQWVVHAPQPEATQPRGAIGVPSRSEVGDFLEYVNVNTGETISIPRIPEGGLPTSPPTGGGSPVGGGGGGGGGGTGGGGFVPAPTSGAPVGGSVPSGSGGGQVVNRTGRDVSLDLSNQVSGRTIRTPDVHRTGSGSGGSARSDDAIGGQVVRINA